MLRATTACTFPTSELQKVVRTWCVLYVLTWKCASRRNGVHFSTSQLPKVVQTWCALYILTLKCASRHNGMQFFISHLASWLRTRRFSEPTFRPTGATNHWKNTVFRDFPTFSRICIFFLLILSLLTLLTSAFQLSILSEVSLLNDQTTKPLHPCVSTPFHPSFLQYLLSELQNFNARKSQHLQSGFRLLSLRLFLQALPAICGFFRFCYSCLYRVRLELK